MVYLGAVLGLRFSEVAGLRVGRMDLGSGSVSVNETITRDSQGRPVFDAPKSAASRRTIALPAPLRELLGDHLRRRGLTEADSDALVFVSPEGGPLRYANWRNRVWSPAREAAGLPNLGFHDLRRAMATALETSGLHQADGKPAVHLLTDSRNESGGPAVSPLEQGSLWSASV